MVERTCYRDSELVSIALVCIGLAHLWYLFQTWSNVTQMHRRLFGEGAGSVVPPGDGEGTSVNPDMASYCCSIDVETRPDLTPYLCIDAASCATSLRVHQPVVLVMPPSSTD